MSSKELKIDSSEEDSLEDLFQDTTELEEEEYINLEDNREGINLAHFSGFVEDFDKIVYGWFILSSNLATILKSCKRYLDFFCLNK